MRSEVSRYECDVVERQVDCWIGPYVPKTYWFRCRWVECVINSASQIWHGSCLKMGGKNPFRLTTSMSSYENEQ